LLIFTTNVNEQIIPNLREQGYKVIVLGPQSIEGVYKDINIVGTATGSSSKATETVNNLRSQISGIQAKITAAGITEKPTVYYEVYSSESGLMTAGNGTWLNDVISTAGGINIFNDLAGTFPYTSSEVVVSRNPIIILLPTNMGTGTPSYGSVADVKARAGWSTISAIHNNRLYVIDQDIMSEPGVRIAEQVQAVAACLYPQLFNSSS
jgi:iron complex transport system substrate-binding protein